MALPIYGPFEPGVTKAFTITVRNSGDVNEDIIGKMQVTPGGNVVGPVQVTNIAPGQQATLVFGGLIMPSSGGTYQLQMQLGSQITGQPASYTDSYPAGTAIGEVDIAVHLGVVLVSGAWS